MTVRPAGDLYIADTNNCRVAEVAKAAGTQWGTISMSANDIYTVAGRNSNNCTIGNNGKLATASNLNSPASVTDPNGNLYIADTSNNRVQEVGRTAQTEFGQSMTANYVYTVAGRPGGGGGDSRDGGAATPALLQIPPGIALRGARNLLR